MSLTQTYQDPRVPASFGGLNALQHVSKENPKAIKKWLATKDAYTLHRPIQKKFQRNRVMVKGLNVQFQSDLVDLQSLAKHNDGYKYLLTCIDIFSKYAWAIPLRDKTGQSVKAALEKIFKDRKPIVLQTDKGKEFKNKIVQAYLKTEKVHFFTTENSSVKASIVERFHRTLKTKMWRYFTEKSSYRYTDILDDLIHSYNRTWHRSIQSEPINVTEQNEKEVWNKLYPPLKKIKPQLKVGDTVRVSKSKMVFEKGYEANWTREIFVIEEIIPRIPPVYKIKDLSDEIIQGTFYEKELQKVIDTGDYPVEKVLKKRKKNGKTEYFVKFLGYPAKFNAWVTDVKKL